MYKEEVTSAPTSAPPHVDNDIKAFPGYRLEQPLGSWLNLNIGVGSQLNLNIEKLRAKEVRERSWKHLVGRESLSR